MPKLYRLPRVKEATGLSEATIYRLMSEGQFPKSVPITRKTKGWIESEVAAWVQSKIDAARGTQAA
jgi:prophage regulatory protein